MALISTLIDDFAALNTGVWNPFGATTVSGGVLNVPCHNTYADGMESVAAYDLRSSQVYWKLAQRPSQGTGTTEGIMVAQGATPSTQEAGFDVTGTSLTLLYKNGTTSNTSITFSATNHKWFRLRHDGGTLYWETAPDSSGAPGSWTTQRSISAPSWASAAKMLFLSGYYGTESSPVALQIDNINTSSTGSGGSSGAGTVPDTPGIVNPGPSGSFAWKGLNWNKRTVGGAPSNSGTWDAANVIVNGDDTITLRLSNPTGSHPRCAEMDSTATGYGYGEYWIVISKNMSGAHHNFVMGGLFTYDDTMAAWTSHREIDVCETSAWGGSTVNLEPGYFTDNPDHSAGIGVSHVVSQTPARNETVETHCMIWEPGRITWRHWSGTDVSGAAFRTDTTTSNVPVPGNENIVANVWDFDPGGANIPQQDVILLDFAFVPRGYVAPSPNVPVSQTFSMPYEAPKKLTAPKSLAYEAPGLAVSPVSKTSILPWESKGKISKLSSLPYEAAGRTLIAVSKTFTLPYESAGSIATVPAPVPVSTPPAPARISGRTSLRVISEIPPTRVHLSASTPSGRKFRWGHDEHKAENSYSGLTWGSVAPGGFDTLDAVLARNPNIDYADLERLTTLQVIGAGGDVVGEYRLERTPMTSGTQMSINPSAVGWQNALEDDKGCSFIGIDRDLSAWGEVVNQLKIEQILEGWNPASGEFGTEPGGQTLDPGKADYGHIYPSSLKLAISAMNQDMGRRYQLGTDRGTWVAGTTYATEDVVSYTDGDYTLTYMRKSAGGGTIAPPLDGTNWQLRFAIYPASIAQVMYDAGAGNYIGTVRGNIGENDLRDPLAPASSGAWIHRLLLERDFRHAFDNATAPMGTSGDIPALWAVDALRRFAHFVFYFDSSNYNISNDLPAIVQAEYEKAWRVFYRYLRVYGNHGIEIRQPTDADHSAAVSAGYFSESQALWEFQALNEGLLASDVAEYIINTFVSALNVEYIEQSTYIVPQLTFKDKTTPGEMLRQTIRFGSPTPDFFVWENRGFHLHRRGHIDRTRRWRARAGPAKLAETGPAVDRLWNSIFVSFSDSSDQTKIVGPPGTGTDYESIYLRDNDPSNPANELGINRRDMLVMNTKSDAASAALIGRLFLEQARQLDRSGSATITGYIQDESGCFHPYHSIRAGDSIQFTDAADTSYRRITKVTNNDDQRTAQVDLDAPPEGLEGLLERLGVALVSLGA